MLRLRVTRFVILSLLCILGLAFALSITLSFLLKRAISQWEWEHTAAFVQNHMITSGLEPFFTTFYEAEMQERWQQELPRLVDSMLGIVRVKVWDSQSTVIWSDNPQLIGQRFPDNQELQQALGGIVTVKIGKPSHEHTATEAGFRGLAEVYIPIVASTSGEVLGVVEIYKDPQQLFAMMQRGRLAIWFLCLTGGVVLYLCLLPLVRQVYGREVQEQVLRAHAGRLEQEVRAVMDNVAEGILTIDEQGTIETCNRAAERMFGHPAAALVGQPVTRILPDFAPPAPAPAGGDDRLLLPPLLVDHRREMHGQHQDGGRIEVEASLSDMITANQRLVIAIVRDITGRKRMEEHLRQAQKLEAIGTLAGGIAHDFNNILTAILGYTELAAEEMPPASPAHCYLQEVHTASRRARDLVQQILTFSRQSEQGYQPVQLSALIKEALILLRASLPTTIAIDASLSSQEGVVLADPTQIHQVLMNLCTNAEQAMRDSGGVLEIRLEPVDVDPALAASHPALQQGPYERLTLRDTGPGIPPDVLPRIFEPFFTTKERGSGTGLGLAVVHGIVTSHNGAITVDSTPGQGTTFMVYLPRSSATPVPAAAASTSPLPHGRGHILLVDDEEPLVRLGQDQLQRLGYTVEIYTSSVDALAAFRAAPARYDLVLTDQTMPIMTGESLVRELRRLRPEMPIILCTGFSHTMTSEKAQALAIDAFLMKPMQRRTLALTIEQVLTRRSQQAAPG